MAMLTTPLDTLQSELAAHRALTQKHAAQMNKQQAVLDVQFQRIADIQAELDLVKAIVRSLAPRLAARLIGARPVVGSWEPAA
jgi:hypothetical protein